MIAFVAALGALVVILAVRAYRADAKRQRALRGRLVTLAVASRATTLADCPPEFHARLSEVMGVGTREVES